MAQERLAEEAASKDLQLAQQSTKGPSSLTYNRNPVVAARDTHVCHLLFTDSHACHSNAMPRLPPALRRLPCAACLAPPAPCCLPVSKARVAEADTRAARPDLLLQHPRDGICDKGGPAVRGARCQPCGVPRPARPRVEQRRRQCYHGLVLGNLALFLH